ncbi:MAG TPA: peptidylprolyl isomerase [Thermoguttaceae bacterium]|nr:peptidylprolyl isomerase [Thermoguttaceae bacterium]
MRANWKLPVACLATITLLMTAGCGGDDEGTPAAINGPQGEGTQADTDPAGESVEEPLPDPKHPLVVLETSLGKITLQLDRQNAPITVDNFLQYVETGHYDGTIFHQLIKDQPKVVIGGAFTADRKEKPARTSIYCEAHNGLSNRRGTVTMARQPGNVHSATSYFFINLSDNQEELDHKDRTPEGYGYCVFGEVVDGMDVLDKILEVEVEDLPEFERAPVEDITIDAAYRLE